uniref:Holliday junction resolvase RuvX n=1 Tax=Ningiella ruwaisensis TaxID=2364274 RepID=UPI0010A03036|nr:Holliday junction resolvase RuvX [Ningiella ruwaisensis]
MHKSALAFDFGMKSIGVALGQVVTHTASPLPALKAKDGIPDWHTIDNLVKDWQPDIIVVGLPLNMDGSEQDITSNAKKFGRRLAHKYNLPVHYHDERLSTVEAKARLFELGGFKKLGKEKVDSVSACLIYESFVSA